MNVYCYGNEQVGKAKNNETQSCICIGIKNHKWKVKLLTLSSSRNRWLYNNSMNILEISTSTITVFTTQDNGFKLAPAFKAIPCLGTLNCDLKNHSPPPPSTAGWRPPHTITTHLAPARKLISSLHLRSGAWKTSAASAWPHSVVARDVTTNTSDAATEHRPSISRPPQQQQHKATPAALLRAKQQGARQGPGDKDPQENRSPQRIVPLVTLPPLAVVRSPVSPTGPHPTQRCVLPKPRLIVNVTSPDFCSFRDPRVPFVWGSA